MSLWKMGMKGICPNCPASSTKKRGGDSAGQRRQGKVVPAVRGLWASLPACSQHASSQTEDGGGFAAQTCRRFHAVVYPHAIHSSLPGRIQGY